MIVRLSVSVAFLLGFLSSCSTSKIENLLGKFEKAKKPTEKIFKVLWNKNVAPSYETGNLPVVFNSPLILEGILYVGDNRGKFKAFDIRNRRLLWEKYDGGKYYGKPIIVDGSIIYGTSQGKIFSRNIKTGYLNFEVMVGDPVESDVVFKDGRIFFQLRNHQVFCLDAVTGKTLWSYKKSIAQTTTVHSSGTPVVFGDYVYVGFADGVISSFRLETGEVNWETSISASTKFNDVDMPPIVVGSSILAYAEGGQLVSIDIKTGKIQNRFDYYPSGEITLIEDRLFFGDKQGNLFVLNKDFSLHKKLTNIVNGKIRYIRSWKNGILILSLHGKALFFKGPDGVGEVAKEVFDLGTKYSLFLSTPEVKRNLLALTSSLGRLVLFE